MRRTTLQPSRKMLAHKLHHIGYFPRAVELNNKLYLLSKLRPVIQFPFVDGNCKYHHKIVCFGVRASVRARNRLPSTFIVPICLLFSRRKLGLTSSKTNFKKNVAIIYVLLPIAENRSIVAACGRIREWQRQANAGVLSGRREYEGVLQRVFYLKPFAPLIEGGCGGRSPPLLQKGN
jgi:hypothetical protein